MTRASIKKRLAEELLEIGAELFRVQSEYDRQLQALHIRHQRIVDRLVKEDWKDSQEPTSPVKEPTLPLPIKTKSPVAKKCCCTRCKTSTELREIEKEERLDEDALEAAPQAAVKPQTTKWRCTRCRRTRYDEPRQVNKTWLSWDKEITRVVLVCEDCYRSKSPCETCAGLAHRVEGLICKTCGLFFAEEVVPQEEAETFSPIAAFENE